MKLHIPVMLAVALCVAADDKGKTDKDKIQGTWRVTSLERNGEKQPEDDVKNLGITLTFDGDKFSVGFQGQTFEGTFKLDPAKKPKTLDITVNGETRLGIYELDGDMLKICRGEPGEDRPTEFKTKEGTQAIFSVSKREKAKDKDKK